MAVSAGPALQELYREFGDRIAFVTIYVREAHPGELVPQHASFEEKLGCARAFQERHSVPWPVAVDDLGGGVHQSFGRMPDAAYVIGADGRVAGTVLWSNDVRGLRPMLEAVAAGRTPAKRRRYASFVPLLRGAGVTYEVLASAGRQAQRDMLLTLPPMYALSRVAASFQPLAPLGRSVAALTAIFGGLLLASRVWSAGWRRPRRPG
jgi:hypothetical protein